MQKDFAEGNSAQQTDNLYTGPEKDAKTPCTAENLKSKFVTYMHLALLVISMPGSPQPFICLQKKKKIL